MTILAGIVGKNEVYIGTDSLISWGANYARPGNTGKFIETPNKDLIIAYCGSIKISQILHYVLNENENKYLLDAKDYKGIKKWSAALKEAMSEWGVGHPSENELPEHGHGFLIACKGIRKIFEIDCDYAVIEYSDYAIQGSGFRYADGAIQALTQYDIDEKEILKVSIKAAINRDPHCGGKVHIRSVSAD